MNRALFICIFFSLCTISCKDQTTTKTEKPQFVSLPTAPLQKLQEIYSNGQVVDVTFYDRNMSMSYDNPQAVKSLMGWISSEAPVLINDCKPNARMDFIVGGNLYMDADVYLQERCTYLIFKEDGVAMYANKFTDIGVQNFSNILKSTGGS